MKEIVLIKNGEIALKGLNRRSFEDQLIRNMKRRLQPLGHFKIHNAQSTLCVEPLEEGIDLDEAVCRLQKVFGIAALCRALSVPKDFAVIKQEGPRYLAGILNNVRTFKVEAKRSDKSFPMKSPEICREFGGVLLEAFPHLRVDVRHPDVTVMVEIRDFNAYIHAGSLPGAGGIPVGTGGKALLLISGGIDSPVAGYMMSKRGLSLHAVHFVSPPYTSGRAREKVETLCEKMAAYCGTITFHCVPFTEIQEAIRDHCPEELFTIIMRRLMMKIAQRIAAEEGALALVTGESMGQVASQTLSAIVCTDDVCEMPVLRPVIGMDKGEIVAIARKIDTFETSILPYEDCCTVFTPKHPRTRPKLEAVRAAEAQFDFAPMLEEAIRNTERLIKEAEE